MTVERRVGDLDDVEVRSVDAAIEEWLTGFRSVLHTTDRLPVLGRVEVVDEVPGRDPRRRRVLVARPFVRLYLDGHLERRLKRVAGALAVDCLSVRDDARTNRLRALLADLDGFRTGRLTWRIRARVAQITGLFLLAAISPIILLASLDDDDLRRSLTAGVLLAIVLVTYEVIRHVALPYGFVPKRALLSGGRTDELVGGVVVHRTWTTFPRRDLYRAEAAVEAALRVPLPPERTIHVSTTLDAVGAVVVVAVASSALALSWFAWGLRPFLATSALMAAWVVLHVAELVANYRLRRARRQGATGTASTLGSVPVGS